MKLLDAKIGQKVRLPGWMDTKFVKWGASANNLFDDSGNPVYAMRDWFERDDWQPAEAPEEKIARLETQLKRARSALLSYAEDLREDGKASDATELRGLIEEHLK